MPRLTAIAVLAATVSGRSRRADQYSDPEHDGAAKHDLEHGLEERGVHVARADERDCPQFAEDDDAGYSRRVSAAVYVLAAGLVAAPLALLSTPWWLPL